MESAIPHSSIPPKSIEGRVLEMLIHVQNLAVSSGIDIDIQHDGQVTIWDHNVRDGFEPRRHDGCATEIAPFLAGLAATTSPEGGADA